MSNQHKSFVTKCVKYLNITLGILMLVLACLNLESILHSITYEKADFEADKQIYWKHLGILQDERTSRLFFQKCEQCHSAAINAIFVFNIEGFILSLFLSVLSFLLALKVELFQHYSAVTVPTTFIAGVITIAYFIFTFFNKNNLPVQCSDAGLEKKCNADFLYQMDYKIFPYSLLMLALVPQFLARSTELIFVKLCFNKKTFAYESKYRFKNKLHSSNSRQYNFELDDTVYDSDFRELPVDCPTSTINPNTKPDQAQKQTILDLDLNNNENKAFSEYYNCEENCFTPQTNNHNDYTEIKRDILENSQAMINFLGRKTFVRSTSLSTIAEERTINNDSSNATTQLNTNSICTRMSTSSSGGLNGRLVIKDLLCEMQNNNAFINEIFHVFEPSSKMGNFNRNVPIRFSSPLKHIKDTKEKIDNSQMSLSLTSLCTSSTDITKSSNSSFSPVSHASQKLGNNVVLQTLIHGPDMKDSFIQTSPKNLNWLSNLVNAKKLRLVKRLKNRIETKTGQKIFSLNLASDNSQFNPRKSICKRNLYSRTSKIPVRTKIEQNYTDEKLKEPSPPSIEMSSSRLQDIDNLNVNFLSNRTVCINIDVEPAYF